MVTQENLFSVLAFVTPGIIGHLMEWRGLDEEQAARLLYESEVYARLEEEETKLWHLSPLALADLLQQELDTGTIDWPEEL
ncbi:MAG: hypothetical protein LBQ92_04790 [Propionibacteriaceae bacterium]|jgi:hypothetical protein|nr:hypothetical protein [Propionibacteriaceae bacterium]